MQATLTLGNSSGLNVTSLSRLSDGVTQTLSGLWHSRIHGFPGKTIIFQRKWPDKSVLGTTTGIVRSAFVMVAGDTTNGGGKPIAPLQPESPSGQLLVELLQSHPHLFSAAAEQQLKKLAEDRDAANGQERSNTLGTELILYKRIAELRAQERRKSLEEIMYALISQRFVEAGISMVPTISSVAGQRIDNWPVQDKELESVHSDEVLEMIREHLFIVPGGRGALDSLEQNMTAQISKLRMGRVYAASVVYGYFLRRVDQRFQLEKTMNILPSPLVEGDQANAHELVDKENDQQDGLVAEVTTSISSIAATGTLKQDAYSAGAGKPGKKFSRLRAYVMSLDAQSLNQSAAIRSKESVRVIEKHTQALFGKPEIKMTRGGPVAMAKDEIILLSFSGLKRLILEAVTFGSFLWDVETYVDTHYNIVAQ